MAMMPKRVKRRKVHRGRVRGHATRGNFVHIGEYGLMAIEPGWIKARQIEAARIAGNRALAGAGRVHIRIFPDKPITSTPAETRWERERESQSSGLQWFAPVRFSTKYRAHRRKPLVSLATGWPTSWVWQREWSAGGRRYED